INIFENSPVNGRWLDFTVRELVPFIDSKFRTLHGPASRAITGDFFGGRGALRMAMGYPDTFGVVYALHPVATGIGNLPWNQVQIDWRRIHAAKSFDDIRGDVRAEIFVAVSQVFLPNPSRPPFYCDFFVEMKNGQLELDPENTRRSQLGFHLDGTLPEHADNLRKLRALGFEWGRFDPTQAHVISNAAFSRQLEDLRIEHEAEEYRGSTWERLWPDDGRVYTRMLPFLDRHLEFQRPTVR
ncbi:MAG: alpha/beta hydrolase-fold protein, partial [Steroidobacter sp.]